MLTQQFEIENHRRQNKNRLGGWTVTIAVHALILLILLFVYITPPNPPYEDNAGGMTVNYGTSAVGTGDQQQYTTVPVTVQQMSHADATPPTTSSAQQDLETQNTEDAPVVEKKTDTKKKEKPNPNALFTPHANTASAATPQPPRPQVDKNALFSAGAPGKPNKSKGDGEGGGQGDQGDPNGDPNSKNYHGGGTGNGPGQGGSGLGNGHYKLKGRKRISMPNIENPCADSRGRVTITIQVNRAGKVVATKFSQAGSTTEDDCLINLSKKEAMQWVFDQKADADDIQTGSILFEYGYK